MLSLKLLFFQKKFGYPAFFQTRNIPTTFSSKLMRGRPLAICARQRKKFELQLLGSIGCHGVTYCTSVKKGCCLVDLKDQVVVGWVLLIQKDTGTDILNLDKERLAWKSTRICICMTLNLSCVSVFHRSEDPFWFRIPKAKTIMNWTSKKNLAELYKQNYSI